MSQVEQELLTLPEHLRSSPVFSGIRVTRSLCLYVCFVDRYLSFCTFFFWPLCCLFFFDIRFLITPLWYLVAIVLSVLLRYTDSDYPPLVSCGHCVVCSSSIYGFWLPPFGILWPLCCLFFFDIRILITPLWYLVAIVLSVLLRYTDSDYPPLVSCGHCVVCSSSIYGFWLPPFGILWTLCCLFFFDIRIVITPLWYLVAIALSVLLRYTDSDYPPLVSCGHCVVCSSSIYGLWLPPFGILWPLCCLFFFDIRILITPLWYLVAIVLSVLLRYTDSDYPPLVSCGHCVVCSSSIYGFWLPPFGILWPLCCLFFFYIRIVITPLWYLVAIVLSVLLRYTDCDYPPLVSCGHCVVCSSSIYGFWLPPFGILWPLCCLFFFYIRIVITPLCQNQ